MSKLGDRTDAVKKLEAEREKHVKAIATLTKSAKAKHVSRLNEKARLEAPANLKDLKVSWTEDGEEKVIGPLPPVPPHEFLQAVDSIPRSVRAVMDNGKAARIDQLRGELNAIPKKYRDARAALETKVYHCDERIAKLKEG